MLTAGIAAEATVLVTDSRDDFPADEMPNTLTVAFLLRLLHRAAPSLGHRSRFSQHDGSWEIG